MRVIRTGGNTGVCGEHATHYFGGSWANWTEGEKPCQCGALLVNLKGETRPAPSNLPSDNEITRRKAAPNPETAA